MEGTCFILLFVLVINGHFGDCLLEKMPDLEAMQKIMELFKVYDDIVEECKRDLIAANVFDAPGDEAPGDEAPGDEAPGNEASGDEAPGDEALGDEELEDEELVDVPIYVEPPANYVPYYVTLSVEERANALYSDAFKRKVRPLPEIKCVREKVINPQAEEKHYIMWLFMEYLAFSHVTFMSKQIPKKTQILHPVASVMLTLAVFGNYIQQSNVLFTSFGPDKTVHLLKEISWVKNHPTQTPEIIANDIDHHLHLIISPIQQLYLKKFSTPVTPRRELRIEDADADCDTFKKYFDELLANMLGIPVQDPTYSVDSSRYFVKIAKNMGELIQNHVIEYGSMISTVLRILELTRIPPELRQPFIRDTDSQLVRDLIMY